MLHRVRVAPRGDLNLIGLLLLQKAEAARQEKNRATVVALNAEIRRAKAKLLEEDLPKLQRLALKKVRPIISALTR